MSLYKKSKSEKIQEVGGMMAQSSAFNSTLKLSGTQWAAILASLDDEEALEDALLIVQEEQAAYRELEKEESRKKTTNKARFKQRHERLIMKSLELIKDQPKQ